MGEAHDRQTGIFGSGRTPEQQERWRAARQRDMDEAVQLATQIAKVVALLGVLASFGFIALR